MYRILIVIFGISFSLIFRICLLELLPEHLADGFPFAILKFFSYPYQTCFDLAGFRFFFLLLHLFSFCMKIKAPMLCDMVKYSEKFFISTFSFKCFFSYKPYIPFFFFITFFGFKDIVMVKIA